jgi:NADPH-dependent curcumin reductase CurA
VGSTAVQFAKNVIGAKRVVGIAGGAAKCAWVKQLGADECVDYKDPNFAANLKAALNGEFADRVFENVGGDVLNATLPLVKRFGKIAFCGMISAYNGENRITLQGFIVIDFLGKWASAVQNVAGWIKEGKVAIDDVETVVSATIEDVPEKYKLLFTGSNRGKLVTALVAKTSSL